MCTIRFYDVLELDYVDTGDQFDLKLASFAPFDWESRVCIRKREEIVHDVSIQAQLKAFRIVSIVLIIRQSIAERYSCRDRFITHNLPFDFLTPIKTCAEAGPGPLAVVRILKRPYVDSAELRLTNIVDAGLAALNRRAKH